MELLPIQVCDLQQQLKEGAAEEEVLVTTLRGENAELRAKLRRLQVSCCRNNQMGRKLGTNFAS